jgi:hypothetical protein
VSDHQFECVEPFGIDNGELTELSPQECFTLGVEWQMVMADANRPEPFARPIHLQNRDRLAEALSKRGRKFSVSFMHDDPSESWLWLNVEATT